MNELIEAFLLGVIQGITEFLPVSSSGHLEIMKFILNDDSLAEQSMMTTVFLHFATAIATIVVFRNDVWQLLSNIFNKKDASSRNFAFQIVISMIPAVVIGLMFEDIIEVFFHKKIFLVACMLIITGILLLISQQVFSQAKPLNWARSLIIGVSQAIAILPGISRSGATISTALLLGVSRAQAARFSFLMVVPLIFGKIAKDLLSGELITNMPSLSYLVIGFLAAFITGCLACTLMINIVKKAKLSYFAYYCFAIGVFIIGYSLVQ